MFDYVPHIFVYVCGYTTQSWIIEYLKMYNISDKVMNFILEAKKN